VLSSKVSLAFAFAVTIVSFISTPEPTLDEIEVLLRTISVGPVCSVTLPTAAKLV
jgi:hypothetical protein